MLGFDKMERYDSTKKVGLFGIIGNLFLLLLKLITAYFSKSEAIFADAMNSFGDIFSSLMTAIGNKIASVPKDEDHNFGHGKAEYIFSLLISIFMFLIACKILIDSILSIIHEKEFIFSPYLIIVCIITIIIKFSLYLISKKAYQKHTNILIKANMNDHRNDIFLTTGTLISMILGSFGYYIFDSIIGAIISLYIMYSGLKIFMESYRILMDVSLSLEEKDKIIKDILKKEKVEDVHDFYTIAIGYQYVAILTIDVDGNLSTFVTHKIADDLEKQLLSSCKMLANVTIHVNPVQVKRNIK